MSSIKFNIAYIKLATKLEGPFTRCCIWFQGCNIKCPGCCNNNLQALKPNHIVTLDELLNIIKEAKTKFNIEGVTLSGGEPTLQIGLLELNKAIKQLNLGLIMFSGKYKKELKQELVNSVDLLIDGPFDITKKDEKRLLLGSTNKNLNFITDRYKSYENYFYNPKHLGEVTVEEYIFINGD